MDIDIQVTDKGVSSGSDGTATIDLTDLNDKSDRGVLPKGMILVIKDESVEVKDVLNGNTNEEDNLGDGKRACVAPHRELG